MTSKFKLLDVVLNKTIQPSDIERCLYLQIATGTLYTYKELETEETTLFNPADGRYKLLPSTGFSDEAGKEIFYGDEIEVPTYPANIADSDVPIAQTATIVFMNGAYGCEMENDGWFEDRFYTLFELSEEREDGRGIRVV